MNKNKIASFTAFTLLLVLTLTLTTSLVSADTDDIGTCGIGMMSGNYGTGIMLFGWIVAILLLIILVLGVVWLIKQLEKK